MVSGADKMDNECRHKEVVLNVMAGLGMMECLWMERRQRLSHPAPWEN